MGLCQSLGERNADGAGGDMHRACGQVLQQAAFAERHALDGVIVREHREDDLGVTGARDIGSGLGAKVDQRLNLVGRPVVYGEIVTRSDQAQRHPRAHLSESDEADFHCSLLAANATNTLQAGCEYKPRAAGVVLHHELRGDLVRGSFRAGSGFRVSGIRGRTEWLRFGRQAACLRASLT